MRVSKTPWIYPWGWFSMQNKHTLINHPTTEDEYFRKHVNAVALMPVKGGRRISMLGRKLFNILLYRSQGDGEREEYEARMHEVLADSDYSGNNTAHVKNVLRELMSTTVEWQSPSQHDIEIWDACNLLSGSGLTKDKRTGGLTIRWRFDSKIREKLLSPDRYARLSLEAITQLSSHSSMALYEICARYVDNPSHKTTRQHWRWWHPVLSGIVNENSKLEYRFFKRDVINKAVAEINALTNIDVKGPIEYKEKDNRTVSDIQFEVRVKGRTTNQLSLLVGVETENLPIIGRGINIGVKQYEMVNLLQKHSPSTLEKAVDTLEKRVNMPTDKVVPVLKPGSWLKAHIERTNKQDSVKDGSSSLTYVETEENIKKHRAAWTDEWLRRRKDNIRSNFLESTNEMQQEILEVFRMELIDTSQSQFLKRFESSGWKHPMIIGIFTKFIGKRTYGDDWDKPALEDILAIAADIASKNLVGTLSQTNH